MGEPILRSLQNNTAEVFSTMMNLSAEVGDMKNETCPVLELTSVIVVQGHEGVRGYVALHLPRLRTGCYASNIPASVRPLSRLRHTSALIAQLRSNISPTTA